MNRLLTCLLLIIAGCQSTTEESTTTFSGNAMTMNYKVVVGKPLSKGERKKVGKIIRKTFEDVNATYNIYNPNSEISQLNQLRAGKSVTLSPQLETLLAHTSDMVQLSKGRFDPTVAPLKRIWVEHLEQGKVPSCDQLQELLPAIGWKHIHIEKGMFWKDHDLTTIDLGGNAKGLCVDLLVQHLQEAGHPDVFVEWGGEIRASGKHPNNRPWNIFISRFGDTSPDTALARLSLNDQAIATSGDYLQYWEWKNEEGNTIRYTHVIDPYTNQPLTVKPISVSVIAPTCVLADSLATAAMLFPTLEETEVWVQELQEQNPSIVIWLSCKKK